MELFLSSSYPICEPLRSCSIIGGNAEIKTTTLEQRVKRRSLRAASRCTRWYTTTQKRNTRHDRNDILTRLHEKERAMRNSDLAPDTAPWFGRLPAKIMTQGRLSQPITICSLIATANIAQKKKNWNSPSRVPVANVSPCKQLLPFSCPWPILHTSAPTHDVVGVLRRFDVFLCPTTPCTQTISVSPPSPP